MQTGMNKKTRVKTIFAWALFLCLATSKECSISAPGYECRLKFACLRLSMYGRAPVFLLESQSKLFYRLRFFSFLCFFDLCFDFFSFWCLRFFFSACNPSAWASVLMHVERSSSCTRVQVMHTDLIISSSSLSARGLAAVAT